MRDIIKPSFGAAAAPKAKTANGSGTLSRGDYRSYKDFLESYGDKNSKDDQESVSSTDSGISSCRSNNTSTSSLNSETNGSVSRGVSKPEQIATRTGSFRDYMENYGSRKFSSVKLNAVPKQNLVKSEIVIQVNGHLPQEKRESNPTSASNVSCNQQKEGLPPQPPPSQPPALNGANQKEFNCFVLPPPLPPPLPQVTSHEEIHNSAPSSPKPERCVPPPPPPPPPMMGLHNPPAAERKWSTVKTEFDRPNCTQSQEKMAASSDAAANLAKILTQNLLKRRVSEGSSTLTPTKNPENGHCSKLDKGTPSPPKGSDSPDASGCFQKVSIVPPPAGPTSPAFPRKLEKPAAPRPPPKAEPAFHTLPRISSQKRSIASNMEFNTTTVVPIADASTKVSKNDPNVRKLVYNTYRGLLGAYNNKANDFIATLPRTMVREDQGVARQLESIALQGGLEKLNGRINPNVEQE